MKYVTINNERFEVKKVSEEKLLSLYREVSLYNGRTLYDCYVRPSETKKTIYKDWLEWKNNICAEFGVRSYSTNFFTLIGSLMLQREYIIVINPAHNILYASKNDTLIDEIVSRETLM